MKRFTFNKQFMVLMFLLLNCFASYAADEDLITKQITIKLTEAGTLPDKIASSKKNLITNLKIIGEINGTDLCFIREMAGSDVNGDRTSGKLSVLDLSEARIVEGGNCYYSDHSYYNNNRYTTSNDIIGEKTFRSCKSLTSVNIPSSVTEIGVSAFEYCDSLKSVDFSNVKWIGSHAFHRCTSLTDIEMSGVGAIGSGAFEYCTSLTEVFLCCPWGIENSVFARCTSLTKVYFIGKKIGARAFEGCTSLKTLKLSSLEMSCIEEGTFSGCSSLTNVNIPSNVTKIGESSFENCTSLTSIDIPSRVTSIGNSSFSGCSSLTSIKIPSNVTGIGSNSFEGCNSLKSIYVFAEDVPSTGNGAFDGCDSKNCTVYVPKGTYDAYWLSEFGYFKNIVEFDATSIHNTLVTPEAQETARYAVNGQRLTAPIKGINLVKYSDGTVKKEFVK